MSLFYIPSSTSDTSVNLAGYAKSAYVDTQDAALGARIDTADSVNLTQNTAIGTLNTALTTANSAITALSTAFNTTAAKTDSVESVGSTLTLGGSSSTSTVNLATGTGIQTVNIGSTGGGATTINVGGPGDTVIIQGTTVKNDTVNHETTDKNILLNKSGLASTLGGSGIDFEEAGSVAAYLRVSTDRSGITMKAPTSSVIDLNQSVATTSSPTFAAVTTTGTVTCGGTVATAATAAVLQQTGDSLGSSKLTVLNRGSPVGSVGAVIESTANDLCELSFKNGASGKIGIIRHEGRNGAMVASGNWNVGEVQVATSVGAVSGAVGGFPASGFTAYFGRAESGVREGTFKVYNFAASGTSTLAGIVLPTTGGTAATLNYYETATHSTVFTGAYTSSTKNFKLVRVGDLVTMTMTSSGLAGTPSTATSLTASTALPSRFCPAANRTWAITGYDNDVDGMAVVRLGTDGLLVITPRSVISSFTIGGGAGTEAFTLSWVV